MSSYALVCYQNASSCQLLRLWQLQFPVGPRRICSLPLDVYNTGLRIQLLSWHIIKCRFLLRWWRRLSFFFRGNRRFRPQINILRNICKSRRISSWWVVLKSDNVVLFALAELPRSCEQSPLLKELISVLIPKIQLDINLPSRRKVSYIWWLTWPFWGEILLCSEP